MLASSSNNSISNATGIPPSFDAMSSTKIFPCNACELVFENSQAQRTHMREPWHVYNLKRRMASLPPISVEAYAATVATSLVSSKQERVDLGSSSSVMRTQPKTEHVEESDEDEDSVDEEAQINCCLFCTKFSNSLEINLKHMSSEHGLFIPEIEHISSLETIIRYLCTVINEYNECLYCGMMKQSAEGVRRHMLDKGHCMINLEREAELLEFWELSDSDDEEAPKPQDQRTDTGAFRDLSQGEYTLPSGKILGSKSKAREARLFTRRTALAAKDTSSQTTARNPIKNADTNSAHPVDSPKEVQGRNQDRTVAVRDAAGLIGVSDQQMRSLITIQRKMQRQQAIVRASAAWADELGGTHQKHYKQKMNLRDG